MTADPTPPAPTAEVHAAVTAYARARRAAGAPLAGALLGALAAAADGTAPLADDEYHTVMTSIAASVIESYAQEQGNPAAPAPRRRPDGRG